MHTIDVTYINIIIIITITITITIIITRHCGHDAAANERVINRQFKAKTTTFDAL